MSSNIGLPAHCFLRGDRLQIQACHDVASACTPSVPPKLPAIVVSNSTM